jgi:hypothetical protein
MLISHSHRFIYLKTIKTAGTSIEIYFERYCVDPSIYPGERHETGTLVSPGGVIGCRGVDVAGETWYNHMPGCRVRELVGSALWDGYYRFCAIRNPFDKAVSHFWFSMPEETRRNLAAADFTVVRAAFGDWVRGRLLPVDRYIYSIAGVVAVNDFIRHESLPADMQRVCGAVGVAWEPERLGRFKSDARVRGEHFSQYYDPEIEGVIRDAYGWELEHFGYGLS